MGMFDYFEPADSHRCSSCGRPLQDFQGKDGPCGLFVWQQGRAEPARQEVDAECMLSAQQASALRLPRTFEFYAFCDACDQRTWFVGQCTGDVWSETRPAPSRHVRGA
jgi:hypothetical protein